MVKVPIVESTIYSLDNSLPFPTLLTENIYYYIHPFTPYFFTDLTKTRYGYLNNLDKCSRLAENHLQCTIDNLHRASDQSCEFQLFLGKTEACRFETSAFLPTIWHQVAPNQWLYILHEKDLLIVRFSPSESQKIFTASW